MTRRGEQRLGRSEASMKVGPFDVRTLDDCLDIVENAFQSAMWKQLPQDEKTRLIGRLSYILEITEKQELEK
jgi:hypothetical protein